MESEYDDKTLTQRWYELKLAFKSPAAFWDYLHVKPTLDENGHINLWINEDLKQTPPDKQTWLWYNWAVFYWGFGFGNWTIGSTMIGIGVNWWHSILIIFTSDIIAAALMFWNSRSGQRYHVGYPCIARSVFGMWGSYYYVGARAVMAIVWLAIQAYSGAAMLDVMLRAIFGKSYESIPNEIPVSQGITSRRMLCFALFWLTHVGLAFMRPYQMNAFYWVKMVMMVIGTIGLFTFCMANTNGNLGTLFPAKSSDSYAWLVVYAINAGVGSKCNFITNMPDMSRWSKSLAGVQWAQFIVHPIAQTLSATFGILATSAMNNKWNLSLWNPWDLLGAILDHYSDTGARVAVALCAMTWVIYYLGVNISNNMLSFGSDASMLFPRFLTIPRGQFLALVLSWGMVPWKILASASVLITFVSGYGMFMASVASIMMCEYYLLTKGNISVSHLYIGNKENEHYWYHGGWNVQALIAYVGGLVMPFPGFLGTLGVRTSTAATRIMNFGYPISFIVSFILYYIICTVWPTENQLLIRARGLGWEEYAMMPAIESIEAKTSTGDLTELPADKKDVAQVSNVSNV